MRELTLTEIKQLQSGEIIPSFRGTIEKVFAQRTGLGEFGAWWLQDLLVTDGNDEITVIWSGEDDLSALQGQTRMFESSETKWGLNGVKRDIRTVKGKQYEGVKLTSSCKIKPVNGERGNETCTRATNDKLPLPPKSNGGPTVQPARPPTNGLEEARRHIMRTCNLYNMCIDAVDKVIKPHVDNFDADAWQAAVATIFIEASGRRCTDGVTWWSFVDKMPDKPIT